MEQIRSQADQFHLLTNLDRLLGNMMGVASETGHALLPVAPDFILEFYES